MNSNDDGKNDWDYVDITKEDIREVLKFPSDFGLSSRHERYEEIVEEKTWCLGPVIETRDSNNLQKSNATALKKYLRSQPDIADDWMITSCNHWAVGWVDHLSFKVLEKDNQPSKVFKMVKTFDNMLQDYPIADEEDYYNLEYEDAIEHIKNVRLRGHEFIDNLPKDWAEQCYDVFSKDDNYGSPPSNESILECLSMLDFLKEESNEDDKEGQ